MKRHEHIHKLRGLGRLDRLWQLEKGNEFSRRGIPWHRPAYVHRTLLTCLHGSPGIVPRLAGESIRIY